MCVAQWVSPSCGDYRFLYYSVHIRHDCSTKAKRKLYCGKLLLVAVASQMCVFSIGVKPSSGDCRVSMLLFQVSGMTAAQVSASGSQSSMGDCSTPMRGQKCAFQEHDCANHCCMDCCALL